MIGGDSPGQVDEKLDNATGCHLGNGRVNPALKPAAGLTGQLVASRGAGNRHGVEVGGLDQHVLRGARNLSARPTHDAGEADGAG